MGKYGKKNEVNLDPLQYGITLLGESGVGKTTLIMQVCEKLAGENGYMFLDCGKEDGSRAITGIVSETCEDWEKFDDVTQDIIDNKATDYPDLKVVVIDTIDQLFDISEPEVVRLSNLATPDKPVSSINAAFSGFGKGQDKAIEIILNRLWELKDVGVSYILIGHVKNKEITDVATDDTYQSLTSNLSQRYFNAIKTKVYFLGLAYIDRKIVKEKTGKKNIVTKKDELKSVVKEEARRINFRDDNFALDSKSRFADIVESIPMNADEFIKAIKDAILSEHNKGTKSLEQSKAEQEKAEAEKLKAVAKAQEENKKNKELKALISQITDFIKENKSDMSVIKPILEKSKELNFANPTLIDNIEDAQLIVNMILPTE